VDYVAGDVVVGRYLVRERVGAGHLGAVYRAEDRLRRQDVALRVLWPELCPDDGARVRFLRGATAARALDCRYVAGVRDVLLDELGGLTACLVVGDFLRRPTLAARMAQRLQYQAPFLPIEVAPIVSQLGVGLSAIHRAGLVLANLTPRSIFFAGDEIRIGDLGVAGSLPAGRYPTAAGDVYALAAVTAEMLGLGGEGLAGEVPVPVRAVLERALSRDPAARFTDADALASALLTAFERGRLPAGAGGEGATPLPDPTGEVEIREDDLAFVSGALLTSSDERALSQEAALHRGAPTVVLDSSSADSHTPITEPPLPPLPPVPSLAWPADPLAALAPPALAPPTFAPPAAPFARKAARVPMALVLVLAVAATTLAIGIVHRLVDAHVEEQAAMARVEKAHLLSRLRDDAAAAARAAAKPSTEPVEATAPAPVPPQREIAEETAAERHHASRRHHHHHHEHHHHEHGNRTVARKAVDSWLEL
jgi:hypothetical protein